MSGNEGMGGHILKQGHNYIATELEYLLWFYRNADFGPADSDVRYNMNVEFSRQTGKFVPHEFQEDD